MPEAVDGALEAFVANLDRAGNPARRYLVAVCGERLPFEKEANSRLRWTSDWYEADFFIAPTHMNCDRALDGTVIAIIARGSVFALAWSDRRALLAPALAHQR